MLPPTKIEQIQFCEAHTPVWSTTPAAIGLTAAQVTALFNATEDARKSYNDAISARDASKAATTSSNADAAIMRDKAADLIRQIKAYAQLQANPAAVYAAAQIPPPAAPTPLPAPGVATNIIITLESTGAVTLSWEATNAAASSGAFYSISRKLPGQAAFIGIGGAPGSTSESRRMSFTDATVPTSAAGAGVSYIIQGQRGSQLGTASEAIVVHFGSSGATGTANVTGAGATLGLAA